MVCNAIGVDIRVLPVNDHGELILEHLERLLDDRTRLVAISHISNALGTINPVHQIIERAHHAGAKVLIDGAQAVPHTPLNMQSLNADFYAFSGHKMYGPTGVGVLFGKGELFEHMPPWQGGGDMIDTVRFSGTTFAEYPHKFEAGTPDIAGVVGLGAAIDFLQEYGLENIAAWENGLIQETHRLLDARRPAAHCATNKTGVSFVIEGVHAHDIGTLLDMEGIAVRTGHHRTQPLMHRFEISGTVRASYAMYNTFESRILCGCLTENDIHVPRRVMGLRTYQTWEARRETCSSPLPRGRIDISKPVHVRAHTAGTTNERDVGRRCTATGRRIGCLNGAVQDASERTKLSRTNRPASADPEPTVV